MKRFFLDASPGRLFFLLLIVPFVIQALATIISMPMIERITHDHGVHFVMELVRGMFIFVALVVIYSVVVLYGWYWSVGSTLHAMLPPNMDLPLGRFRAALLFPATYVVVFILGFIGLFMLFLNGIDPHPEYFLPVTMMAVIFPMHFLSLLCMLYAMRFVAKVLKSVEMKEEVHFWGYFPELLALWFWPFGIWWLQPRIQARAAQPQSQPGSSSGDPFLQG